MRKHAPALILTLLAFASGSAMALGDRAKDKKTTDTQSMTQPAASANVATPGSNPSPNNPTKATGDGSSASPTALPPSGSASAGMSADGATAAATNGTSSSKPDMEKKKKDGRCDESRYPDKAAIPPECAEKVSPGASGASGAGSAGGAGSGTK